ncbi:hypothetical protein ABFA07_020201 [Porites harrisoni]
MTTLRIYVFLLGTLALGEMANAGTKTKCDVVRALRIQNVPNSDMRDWLCLVNHESGFQYDIVHENSDGSKDYGIYQLNDNYWCDQGDTKYTSCWQINTFGCGYKCSDFTDSVIAWDTDCAVKIKNCNSFSKWRAWQVHCQGDLTTNPDYDFSHC